MNPKALLLILLTAFPFAIRAEDAASEDVAVLSPFVVTTEEDRGYQASSTLAGLPELPVTIVKRAEALVIQFALATTSDKADVRNAELTAAIDAITKAVQATPGLRFEPREVFLASADRKKSLVSKGGVVTSFANFVVFADFSEGMRPYQRVKQVRDLLSGLKLATATTKVIDGPVGLFLRRPSQYRVELLAKIFDDLAVVKKGLGPEFEVLVSGLSGAVRMRTCSETDVELWIDYGFTIRSIRELEAKKK